MLFGTLCMSRQTLPYTLNALGVDPATMGIIGQTSHNLCRSLGELISYLAPRVTPGVPSPFLELGSRQVLMPGPQADASQWAPAHPDAA